MTPVDDMLVGYASSVQQTQARQGRCALRAHDASCTRKADRIARASYGRSVQATALLSLFLLAFTRSGPVDYTRTLNLAPLLDGFCKLCIGIISARLPAQGAYRNGLAAPPLAEVGRSRARLQCLSTTTAPARYRVGAILSK